MLANHVQKALCFSTEELQPKKNARLVLLATNVLDKVLTHSLTRLSRNVLMAHSVILGLQIRRYPVSRCINTALKEAKLRKIAISD